MNQLTRVRVVGPLEPFAPGYRRELVRRGYSSWTVVSYLYSAAGVSRWLAEHGLTAADLGAECGTRFLTEWRAGRAVSRGTPRGMTSLLGYLRGLGVAPAASVPASVGPREELLARFVGFLREC